MFFVLAHCSLFLFEPVLFEGSHLEFSVFQGSLVRSTTGVCGGQDRLQELGEVVQLEHEVAHAVHVLPLLGVGGLPPNHLLFAQVLLALPIHLLDPHLVTPTTVQLICKLGFGCEDLTVHLECV